MFPTKCKFINIFHVQFGSLILTPLSRGCKNTLKNVPKCLGSLKKRTHDGQIRYTRSIFDHTSDKNGFVTVVQQVKEL